MPIQQFESDDVKLVRDMDARVPKKDEKKDEKANPYYDAYKEIYDTNEHRRKTLSPLAKSLFDGGKNNTDGIPFPDGGQEANDAFVKKHGPEKAIQALDALMKHVDVPEKPGEVTMKDSRLKELQGYKDKILGEQGF